MTTTVSPKHRLLSVLGLSAALFLAGLAACDAAGNSTGVAPSAANAVSAMSKQPVTTIQFEGTLDLTDPATGKVRHLHVHPTDGGTLKIDPSFPGSSDSGSVTIHIESLGGEHVQLSPGPDSR